MDKKGVYGQKSRCVHITHYFKTNNSGKSRGDDDFPKSIRLKSKDNQENNTTKRFGLFTSKIDYPF